MLVKVRTTIYVPWDYLRPNFLGETGYGRTLWEKDNTRQPLPQRLAGVFMPEGYLARAAAWAMTPGAWYP